MARSEELVARIRRTLGRGGAVGQAEVAALAREYTEAVEAVNERLRRCAHWLHQGLRSEAMHEAELTPAVLDEAATLEFPEREYWLDLCEQQGLEHPPGLDTEAANEINEAYAAHEQVEPLLRQQRQLALARAPLRQRIHVLRRLSQVDMANPIWGEDLLTHERARHQQIANEADEAYQDNDLQTLNTLQEECAETWLDAPSPRLIKGVQQRRRRVRAAQAAAQLKALEPSVAEAYQAGDTDRLNNLLGQVAQLEELTDHHTWQPSAELAEARHWLTEQIATQQRDESFKQHVEALSHALDDQEPIPDLERRWQAIERFDQPVPEAVRRRYHARLEEHRLERARRFRLKMAGIVGALVLAGLGTWWLTDYLLHNRAVERWSTTLEQRMNDGQLTQAANILTDLEQDNPEVRAAPAIRDLASDLEQLQAEDALRQEKFNNAIQAAEAAGGYEQAQEPLNNAAKLAKHPDETQQVERLRAEYEQQRVAAQTQRDEDFRESLATLSARYQQLADGSPTETIGELRTLKLRLLDLQTTSGISESVRQSANPLKTRLDTRIETIEADLNEREAIAAAELEIQKLYDEPAILVTTLQRFQDNHASHARARAFDRTLQQRDGWRVLDAWGKLRETHDTLIPKDADEAAALSEALESFKESHTPGPLVEPIDNHLAYLDRAESALRREAQGRPIGDTMQRLLSHPTVDGVYTFETEAGNLYYQSEPEPPHRMGSGDQWQLTYVSTFEQLVGRDNPEQDRIQSNAVGDNPQVEPAPQQAFVDAARSQLEHDAGSWQDRRLRVLELLIEHDRIDPILRVTLARSLAQLSLAQDAVSLPELTSWHKQLSALDTDVAWMDPHRKLTDERERARKLLAQAPDVTALRQQMRAAVTSRRAALAEREPVAVLWKNDNGAPSVHQGVSKDIRQGVIEAVVPDGTSWRLQHVADVQSGTYNWRSNASALPAGSILFRRQHDAQTDPEMRTSRR